MNALIGIKLGMTQRFAEDGKVIPLTVIKAGPCVVVQRKTETRDGYDAVQLGPFVLDRRDREADGSAYRRTHPFADDQEQMDRFAIASRR